MPNIDGICPKTSCPVPMNRDQDQLSQLVRYASLCDILAGCSQFADLVSVCDYITKKLKYVINGYAWTYHAVRDGVVQIVAENRSACRSQRATR